MSIMHSDRRRDFHDSTGAEYAQSSA